MNGSERGAGRAGCIVGLIFLIAVGMIAAKMIPVKVRAAELRQVIEDEAKAAGTKSNKKMRQAILTRAEELDLPLEDEDLEITRRANRIIIEAEYYTYIEFPGYTHEWRHHHKAENPIF